MSYASVTQLRKYLKQVPSGATYDAELQDVLDAATGIIDALLGFSYAALAGLPSPVQFYAPYPASVFLKLPVFQAGTVDRVYEGDDESGDEFFTHLRDVPAGRGRCRPRRAVSSGEGVIVVERADPREGAARSAASRRRDEHASNV